MRYSCLMPLAVCSLWYFACGGGSHPPVNADTPPHGDTLVDTSGTADGPAIDAAPTVDDALDTSRMPETVPHRAPLRVLFVGNSYTAVNDLPAVVEQLVEHSQTAVEFAYETIAPGGATLADHYYTPETRARISSGDFDVVVIQGQSTEPLRQTGFSVTADILASEARGAGARVVFFATWARRPGDPYYEELAFGGFDTPNSMTHQLDVYYNRPNALTARVGFAFLLATIEVPEIELYAEDGSHPSGAGTLLAAMVVAQAVAGATPTLPEEPILAVPISDAERLRALVPTVACYGTSSFCDGMCVPLGSDRQNCGACGVVCAEDEPCTFGECGCPSLEQTACARRCVYLPLDHQHCGTCGNACVGGSRCSGGQCECLVHEQRTVPLVDLGARQPACSAGGSDYDPSCAEAAHEVCAALDCFTSGFGPQSPATFNPEPPVTCVSGEVVDTTWSALAALEPKCSSEARGEQPCTTAVHRLCTAAGAVSGFGPVGINDETIAVTCLHRATLVPATWADLAAQLWSCGGNDSRPELACDFAGMARCRTLGYLGGFGPVEVDGDALTLVCLDE